jgi:hypothetical protein
VRDDGRADAAVARASGARRFIARHVDRGLLRDRVRRPGDVRISSPGSNGVCWPQRHATRRANAPAVPAARRTTHAIAAARRVREPPREVREDPRLQLVALVLSTRSSIFPSPSRGRERRRCFFIEDRLLDLLVPGPMICARDPGAGLHAHPPVTAACIVARRDGRDEAFAATSARLAAVPRLICVRNASQREIAALIRTDITSAFTPGYLPRPRLRAREDLHVRRALRTPSR